MCYIHFLLLQKEWPQTWQLKHYHFLAHPPLRWRTGWAPLPSLLQSHKPTIKALAGLNPDLKALGETPLLDSPGSGGIQPLVAVGLGSVPSLAVSRDGVCSQRPHSHPSYVAASTSEASDVHQVLVLLYISHRLLLPPAGENALLLKTHLAGPRAPGSSPSHPPSSAQGRVWISRVQEPLGGISRNLTAT